tara:strand:+ start:354 stop:674 length:321 start_codon:yes stop_codon:yes gene_type:complete
METLSDISLVQWMFIAVGLVIALPPVLSFLKGSVKIPEIKVANKSNELSDLVRKWEALSDACQESGLHKACQTLDGVFPLLVEVRENAIKVEPEPDNSENLIPQTI